MRELTEQQADFAERTFGIKAKLVFLAAFSASYFAERTFGIKAKLLIGIVVLEYDFAERTFGIKAKQAG